jgi:hypothetical protein
VAGSTSSSSLLESLEPDSPPFKLMPFLERLELSIS